MAEVLKGKITILSPVHVGSGRGELILDYDFIKDNRFIRVIDQEKMFSTASEEAWAGHDVDVRISQLLKPEQYESCSLYSFSYPGGSVSRIMEHIKSAHHCPYIPGSSLKGAIRTALAWAMVKNGVVIIRGKEAGDDSRSADDFIEADLFGTNPNRDMMRALQVADASGGRSHNGLALSNVALYSIRDMMGNSVLMHKGTGFTFNVEVIPVGAELEFSIKLDGYLLRENVSQCLGFNAKKNWLMEFPKHCNAFAQEIIRLELDFYAQYRLPRVKAFYESLKKQGEAINPDRQFLLQIAWGTGWRAKTIGTALEADILDKARRWFNLGKRGYPIFPKTRRLVERGNVPEMPPGWIRVDLA